MRVYQSSDYKSMSRKAANIISAQIIVKPNCVLGLATGNTPLGAYKQLITWEHKGDLSFSLVSTVNLDEYVGLDANNNQSYNYFMNENLFSHVKIKKENTFIPDGLANNLQNECERYDNIIKNLGGIDLQLLGIGHNGHIGFNEPNVAFELGTHTVNLAKETIAANARFFNYDESKVPTKAITMGIKNIMHAKQVLVTVSGQDKADIILKAFKGPVTPAVPASILQLHPNLTIVGDKAALEKLLKEGVQLCD